MKFHVLTLFPEMILAGLGTSITGRAIRQNLIGLDAVNIRDFSQDKHNRVDDYTYGGGAGMLMQPQPVYDAWKSVTDNVEAGKKVRTIYVTPQGLPFTQRMAEDFAGSDELIFICGHYEGIDERVLEETVTDYVSIGDYVLTGGELASMVMIDCISRLVPGVLHNEVSADTESFHGNLLEYPQYSRPEIWHGKQVPEVLLSGNQKEIDAWRLEQSLERTRQRRPDLYQEYEKLQKARKILMKEKLLHMDMISLIDSGRAQILFQEEHCIALKSMNQSTLYFSNPDQKEGMTEKLMHYLTDGPQIERVVFHQPLPEEVKDVGRKNAEGTVKTVEAPEVVFAEIRQEVLTRKEKLPVRGLYRPDGKPSPTGLTIRPVSEDIAAAYSADREADSAADYKSASEKEGERALKQSSEFAAACLDNQIIGLSGIDRDGRISLLYVLPQYRRQKVGSALLTWWCNELLLRDSTPYLTCPAEMSEFLQLAEKIGMYPAKTSLWELEIKK